VGVIQDGAEAADVVLEGAGGAEGGVCAVDGGEGAAGGVHEAKEAALVAVGGERGAGNGGLEEDAFVGTEGEGAGDAEVAGAGAVGVPEAVHDDVDEGAGGVGGPLGVGDGSIVAVGRAAGVVVGDDGADLGVVAEDSRGDGRRSIERGAEGAGDPLAVDGPVEVRHGGVKGETPEDGVEVGQETHAAERVVGLVEAVWIERLELGGVVLILVGGEEGLERGAAVLSLVIGPVADGGLEPGGAELGGIGTVADERGEEGGEPAGLGGREERLELQVWHVRSGTDGR
jgi:hypothetical protein